jgi:hypothetical protein
MFATKNAKDNQMTELLMWYAWNCLYKMETCYKRSDCNKWQLSISLVYGEDISCNSKPVSADFMMTLKCNIVYELLACSPCFEIRNTKRVSIIAILIYRKNILGISFGAFLLVNGPLYSDMLTLTDHMYNRQYTMRYKCTHPEGRIQSCKTKWHNHILRIESSTETQRVNYQPEGYINVGRPKTMWG